MSVCLSVCRACISLFLMHGHSFERSWTKSGTWHWPSVQIVSDVCLTHTCSLDTSAIQRLRGSWRQLRSINLLTYLLIPSGWSRGVSERLSSPRARAPRGREIRNYKAAEQSIERRRREVWPSTVGARMER